MDKVLECSVWAIVYPPKQPSSRLSVLRSPIKLKIMLALSVTNNFNVLAIILKLR
ncbi:MAG: hypothetical protein V7K71_28525 [Nostoc sp.]|uniref:hypothetical protein n=1 Tax=Nostoc sp. TaxID=1180 RepID=UPI002FFC72F7